MSHYEFDTEQRIKDANKEIKAFYTKLKQTFHYVDPMFLSDHKGFFYLEEKTDLQNKCYVKVGKLVNGAMKYGIINNPLNRNVNDCASGVSPNTKHTLLPCVFNSVRVGKFTDEFHEYKSIVLNYKDKEIEISTVTLAKVNKLINNNEIPQFYSETEAASFIEMITILKNYKEQKKAITLNDKIAKASIDYLSK